MSKLRVLDLFSGIGGFSLGLERTGGFETVAFCEIEPFPRKVLAKHWPEVPCYEDVTKLTGEQLAADGIAVDVITGGFPCQDISFAGKGAGLAGKRSGLFYEIARLVGELGPRFIILENVGALLSRGLDAVLGTLASLGYDAEWHCIPASYVGAPHRRDRVWIVAYPQADALRSDANSVRPYRTGMHVNGSPELRDEQICQPESLGEDVADAECVSNFEQHERNLLGRRPCQAEQAGLGCSAGGILAAADNMHEQGFISSFINAQGWPGPEQGSSGPCGYGFEQWSVEPNVGRVANGIPDRAHRLAALGNAVVPQIPELIGNAILASREAA